MGKIIFVACVIITLVLVIPCAVVASRMSRLEEENEDVF